MREFDKQQPITLKSFERFFAVGLILTLATLSWSAYAKIIEFDPAGSVATQPTGISAKGWIAGFYQDDQEKYHSFLRSPRGAVMNFDVNGANCGTLAQGINRAEVITGNYNDSSCFAHGFVRAKNGTIITFDVSGATDTEPRGINDVGTTTGFLSATATCTVFCELRTALSHSSIPKDR